MIEQEREKVRTIAWNEVCPWLSIFRTFRLAIRARALVFGAVAMLITLSGWSIVDWVFSGGNTQCVTAPDGSVMTIKKKPACPWTTMTTIADVGRPTSVDGYWKYLKQLEPVRSVWVEFGGQFSMIFEQGGMSVVGLARALLCGLWAVAVWGFFGGAITRSAALELAADERIGTGELVAFVMPRWRAYIAAPLFPMLGVFLATVGIFIVSLLLLTNVTAWIAAILWPFLLLGGLIMAVLLLGLWFGWPLMYPTISAEGTDSFDALSRTYAYVFQRPLQYLFYIVVAAAFGLLGWILVAGFASGVIGLTNWAASWACGSGRMAEIGSGEVSAGYLIGFWQGCVKILAVGFLYSYFWSAATAIYFLLRRNVDATEMDEVYLDEDEAGEIHGLPSIGTDEKGAPTVDEADETPAVDEAAGEVEKEEETSEEGAGADSTTADEEKPEGDAT